VFPESLILAYQEKTAENKQYMLDIAQISYFCAENRMQINSKNLK